MREEHLRYLACPTCQGELRVTATSASGGRVHEGALTCAGCSASYPIRGAIPRFVPADNYATSFGFQWKRHARTQHDSYTGLPLSEKRFFGVTRWERDLPGEVVLEVAGGSGRFTTHAASTGAQVISLDYSLAVEANQQINSHLDNLTIVQGDVYHLPLRRGTFDKVFCFGMLQHTPDVEAAFKALPRMLRPGGHLAVDVYRRSLSLTLLSTKYYARRLTRRIDPETLYRWTVAWVNLMWPLCSLIRMIPVVGTRINWRLLVADHSALGLREDHLKEWAILDTFDMLSPRYDSPQTARTLRTWFEDCQMSAIDVHPGMNGVEGRGQRPA